MNISERKTNTKGFARPTIAIKNPTLKVPKKIISMRQIDNFVNENPQIETSEKVKSVIGDGMNARERRHARRRAERETLEKKNIQCQLENENEYENGKEKWATNILYKSIKQDIQKSDVIMKERDKLYYLDWDDDDAWD